MSIGRIPFARALIQRPPSAADARAQLRAIAAALVDRNGRIKRGYLRLSETGSRKLRAGGFFTSGNTRLAASSVKALVQAAYGKALGPAANRRL